MVYRELLTYVKSTLAQGFTQDEIRQHLLGQGWHAGDIDDAFAAASKPGAVQQKAPPLQRALSSLRRMPTGKRLLKAAVPVGAAVVIIIIVSLFIFKDIFKEGSQPSADPSELEAVLLAYIQAAQAGDLDQQFSHFYYSHVEREQLDALLAMDPSMMDVARESLQEAFQGLEIDVKDSEVLEDSGVLIVGATKQGRTKADKPLFFIKDGDSWKINAFGYAHPPDTVLEPGGSCNDYCASMGYWASGNKVNMETNECTCWHDAPSLEDLSDLDVEECEEKEKGFRETCYMVHAMSENDERYCKKVSSMNRDDCYKDVAIAKKDPSVCDYLWQDKECLEQASGA